jgi:hypothetical protein
MKIKISAAPVDREKNSLELVGAGFFNLSELRTLLLRFFDDSNLPRDVVVHTTYIHVTCTLA